MEKKSHYARSLLVPLLIVAAVALPIYSATAAPNNTCFQKRYTITGTNGDDRLIGTPGADVIHGLGGDDVIKGRGGKDLLCGGVGDDRVFGGKGANSIKGEKGSDVLEGGPRDDRIDGGLGDDRIEARGGDDEIDAQGGVDRSYAGAGADFVSDGTSFPAGNSLIDGGSGDDTISAGQFMDGHLMHKVVAGAGDDYIYYAVVDIVLSGPGDDRTDTDEEDARIRVARGGPGNDLLDGELVYGGSGQDHLVPPPQSSGDLYGGPGDDMLRGWEYDDLLSGGRGDDELRAERGYGEDELLGGEGDDTLRTDDLVGGDRLDGGAHLVGDTCLFDATDTATDCEV